jgi:hypothetical protein
MVQQISRSSASDNAANVEAVVIGDCGQNGTRSGRFLPQPAIADRGAASR